MVLPIDRLMGIGHILTTRTNAAVLQSLTKRVDTFRDFRGKKFSGKILIIKIGD